MADFYAARDTTIGGAPLDGFVTALHTEGLYKGRPADAKRNADIAALLAAGHSWTFVQRTTGASRSTLARIRQQMVAEQPAS